MHRRNSGFTLIEILVVGSLLLIIFMIVAGFLIPGLRAWMRGREQSQAQQAAMLAVASLREEARWAHPESLAPINATSLRIYSSRCPDGPTFQRETGKMEYHSWEVFYLDQGVLRHRTIALPLDADGKLPTELPGNPDTACPPLAPSATDRVVARNIEVFQCRSRAEGGVLLVVESRVGAFTSQIETLLSPAQSGI